MGKYVWAAAAVLLAWGCSNEESSGGSVAEAGAGGEAPAVEAGSAGESHTTAGEPSGGSATSNATGGAPEAGGAGAPEQSGGAGGQGAAGESGSPQTGGAGGQGTTFETWSDACVPAAPGGPLTCEGSIFFEDQWRCEGGFKPPSCAAYDPATQPTDGSKRWCCDACMRDTFYDFGSENEEACPEDHPTFNRCSAGRQPNGEPVVSPNGRGYCT